jgi:hypothetical protein
MPTFMPTPVNPRLVQEKPAMSRPVATRPVAPRPATPPKGSEPPQPWWRESMMWLVVAGPMLVVLAGVWTAVLAVRGADPVIRADRQGPGAAAVQARNHAATPPQRTSTAAPDPSAAPAR